jgi:putative transposase
MDHVNKTARGLVGEFDVILHEALRIANMVRNPKLDPDQPSVFAQWGGGRGRLNRSIHDAGGGCSWVFSRTRLRAPVDR